jgi:hypothetical protein
MRRRYDPSTYPASNFDDDMCLKPPLLLWLTLLYLCRGVLLPVAMGLGHYVNMTSESLATIRGLWDPSELISAALAAPVLFSLLRRAPGASAGTRWIWARGWIILTLATAADLALSVLPLHDFENHAFSTISAAVIDGYFLVYLLAARRVRDTFSDFPAPLHVGAAKKRAPGQSKG